MSSLPEGVRREDDTLIVDLDHHPQLAERDGTLVLKSVRVVVVRGKKKLRAFSLRCPHKPKKDYLVHAVKDAKRPCFQCSAHRWQWDQKGRPKVRAKKPLARLRAQLEGRELRIRLNSKP